MINSRVPVILLDCDIRAIEGVISSFGKKNIPMVAVSAQEKTPAFRSRYISTTYQSPEVSDETAYLDFLLNLPERGVLLYSDDASASFVAKHATTLREAGYLLNIASEESFERGFDKASLAEAAEEAGVPVIPTIRVHTLQGLKAAWEQLDKPIILKATRLAGGKFELIHKEEELAPAFEKMEALIHAEGYAHMHSGLIAQEFIQYEYDEIYCCESYYTTRYENCGFLSIHKIRPNINRDGTAGGRLFAGETIRDEPLEAHTQKILDHLQWKGFAHLDWIYSRKYQQYLLCEINPRLPGFSNLLGKVGFDMAYYYYADLCRMPLPTYQFKKALYYEALRMPGDISTGVYAMLKGHLKPMPFLQSYLRLLSGREDVCLDIFYGSDPSFTAACWSEQLKYLLRRPFRAINPVKKKEKVEQ